MKNPNLVIDIGQTFIKFVVIDNFKVIDHKILKNKLLIKKKILNYNIIKLKAILISNIKKILKKHNIKKIIPITHGSAAFFITKKKEYFSGPYFLQNTKSSFDKAFFNVIKKKDYTHSINFGRYHNLGKSFYYLLQNCKKLNLEKILTFPSFINFILTGKLHLDRSYLACHSFAWNFKKGKLIDFFYKYKKTFPKITKSGKKIGIVKKEFSRNQNITVLNGIHDTSGSYLAFNQNIKHSESLIINTGTYFIISKKTKFKSNLKKNFYLNYGADNNLYLCRRINIGLIFERYNPKVLFKKKKFERTEIDLFLKKNKKKTFKLKTIKKTSQINDYLKLNFFIAKKLSKQINYFIDNENKLNKIFIDGNFANNKVFIDFLNRSFNGEIYIDNNSFINCLGASTFFNKKKLNLRYKRVI